MNVKDIFKKLLDALQVKPTVGGLEINDAALRYVFWDGSHWEAKALRLPPGIVVGGKVANRAEMVSALASLRQQVLGKKASSRHPLNAIVSLSSINIYTQIFNLPPIEGENLEKAIQLNIQMASPTGSSDTYAGWQLVNRQDDMRLEILSAFLNKAVVDELTGILHEAKFMAVAIESRALSLARVVKDNLVGEKADKPVIVVGVDSSGVDVMIVRHGHLHFDYFNSWKDLRADAKEISMEAFRDAIVRSVQQVINFHAAHWQDSLSGILISAGAMADEISKLLTENFQMPVENLRVNSQPPLGPEWFVALGGAMRGRKPRRDDEEISLLGIGAQEEFRRQEIIGFTEFWRLLTPLALAVLLLAFAGTYIFLNNEYSALQQKSSVGLAGKEASDLALLQKQAADFNATVDYISFIESSTNSKIPALDAVLSLMNQYGITPSRITMDVTSGTSQISGSAKTSDAVISFKNDLDKNPLFQGVNLPLSAIRGDTINGYSFSISLTATSPKRE